MQLPRGCRLFLCGIAIRAITVAMQTAVRIMIEVAMERIIKTAVALLTKEWQEVMRLSGIKTECSFPKIREPQYKPPKYYKPYFRDPVS